MNIENLNYTPFARKYRPKNFLQLKGQEVLVKSLSYCIENNKISQTYLLSGIRGIGKTSAARIIAKTVNCTNRSKEDNYIKACDQCTNCKSCNDFNHPDIIEIDAASKTSIDDIREIIESSEYKPLIAKYKIFIVDELHMLSKNAFNAMLKTIEEPPEHVIFLFATTEIHKLPLTILSRCHRYDLKRLSSKEIYSLLVEILNKEGIDFESEALHHIIKKSEGSARDAITLLEQATHYNVNTYKKITTDNINQMLGIVNTSIIIELLQHISKKRDSEALNIITKIYNTYHLKHFFEDLTNFIANLCKIKITNDYSDSINLLYIEKIKEILVDFSLSRLNILWQIFNNGIKEIKDSHNELINAEMLIIKALYASTIPSIEDIAQLYNQNKIDHEDKAYQITENKKKVNISSFLKFCISQNNIGIYYTLLNEVEIIDFNDQILKIVCVKDINNIEITKLLKKWGGSNNWLLIVNKVAKITTIKNTMITELQLYQSFQKIEKYFPKAKISDIILKN